MRTNIISFYAIWKAFTFIFHTFIIHTSSLSIPQFKYLPDPIHNQTSRINLLENVTFKDILKRYAVIFEYQDLQDSCCISLSNGSEGVHLVTRLIDVFKKLLEINLMGRNSKFMHFKMDIIGKSSFRVMFELLENPKESKLTNNNID
jgi:hypothetical protein